MSQSPPQAQLAQIINAAIAQQGTIVIPDFAVGRTQSVLYYISQLKERHLIPNIPVFLDSPLAEAVTDIYTRYIDEHRLGPAQCAKLSSMATYINTSADSKSLDDIHAPAIIVASSGMATGGRVLQHIKAFAPHARNTMLFAGYQAEDTLGEEIVTGHKEVEIHGEKIKIHGQVALLNNMSAHADSIEILSWLSHLKKPPRKIFITHGEPESAIALKQKIAAGSTHIVIDIPIGPTAKVTSLKKAELLKQDFIEMSKKFGVTLDIVFSDGTQPVGRGIGPALEAGDVLAVLQCAPNALQDLRDHSLTLAGRVLEFSPNVRVGTGRKLATEILDSGRAFNKFKAICEAQGGMREPPVAQHQQVVLAPTAGTVSSINNQFIAKLAKLAGAPKSKSAGVELLTPVGTIVTSGQLLYIVHAETQSELLYAMNYVNQGRKIIEIKEKK